MSPTLSLDLYPEIRPFKTEWFAVSPIHTITVEQYGNPIGVPILFLHGGPGSGMDAHWARLFCPDSYRIIAFDQRGCGKSLPNCCLEENTTWHLVEDIETIRQHLKINHWHLAGGSWGSTLALAYAEKYPQLVDSLILWSIFLGRKKEIDWFYQKGASAFLPEAWEEYLTFIPLAERHDLVDAYHTRLNSTDKKTRLAAAKAWATWDATALRMNTDLQLIAELGQDHLALPHSMLECHYFKNLCFFTPDDQLLRNAATIRHIPTTIIHARYDLMCPIETAWELHKALPDAEFVVVPEAGHSARETNNSRAIIMAANKHLVTSHQA